MHPWTGSQLNLEEEAFPGTRKTPMADLSVWICIRNESAHCPEMKNMSETICHREVNARAAEKKPKELDVKVALSPVLARLIEEVRNEKTESPHPYNRMHNRHNRSR
jgi:hypothetical protein